MRRHGHVQDDRRGNGQLSGQRVASERASGFAAAVSECDGAVVAAAN